MAEQIYENKRNSLTSNLVPRHYELHLKPDLKSSTFEGTVSIEFVRSHTINIVTLHALELKIIEGYANSEQRPLKQVIYNCNETANLIFDRQDGEIRSIFLKFKGTLNDKMKGFYRTSFRLEKQTVYAVVTQFEATFARRCFPCWDEPAYKSTFSVTLEYSRQPFVPDNNYNLVPLSNMPTVRQIQGDTEDECVAVFETTPMMSTYLLAFAIGPFEYIEKVESNRTIRVYTGPGKKELGQYALDVASRALTFYEQYFNVPYPLPKLDLLALAGLSFEAEENWGLVTFREDALLADPSDTSSNRKQDIALIVSHELAHQWFGNLVTMKWWTHLWLNEGFATFMGFLCVDHIFPEYDVWPQFAAYEYTKAMDLDSFYDSHPIEVPVEYPVEIGEIFDAISESKGAALIRMLHHYTGDGFFREGMNDYLTKFAYKNTVTEDLWDALGASSRKPVREVMSGWTSQTGYPWLRVFLLKEEGKTKVILTQKRFHVDRPIFDEKQEHAFWMIPITATTSTKIDVSELMGTKSCSFSLDEIDDGWIKLNPNHIGLYRISYRPEMLARFHKAILDQSLPAMDRLGIQDDFFALCQAGKKSTADWLRLLEAYKNETNFNVWRSINRCLGKLNVLLYNKEYIGMYMQYTHMVEKFNYFKLELLSKIYESVTWNPKPNESQSDRMLRVIVISGLITCGYPVAISEAKRRFKAYLDKTETISMDLRGTVFKCVSLHGDDALFDQLFELYKSCDSQEEKLLSLTSLASTKKGPRLDRIVSLILSDEVSNEDKLYAAFPIGLNNPQVAWKMLTENKDFFREIYGSSASIGRLVRSCIENFADYRMAAEVERFFRENKFPGAEKAVEQSVRNIRIYAAWFDRDSKAMREFLYRHK